MKPQETTNYELLGNDWATRAPYAQTLQTVCHTCLRTTTTCAYTFARFSFSRKYKPTRTSPVKQRVQTTTVIGARGNLEKRQITSCLGRTGQHARRSRKHCRPCAIHAHTPPPRARTRLHGFHSVGNSNLYLSLYTHSYIRTYNI